MLREWECSYAPFIFRYDYTLKDLNKTDYFAKHNITQPIKLYINKLFNLLLILDHIEGLSVFNITGSNFKLCNTQIILEV